MVDAQYRREARTKEFFRGGEVLGGLTGLGLYSYAVSQMFSLESFSEGETADNILFVGLLIIAAIVFTALSSAIGSILGLAVGKTIEGIEVCRESCLPRNP